MLEHTLHYLRVPQHTAAFPVGENIRRTISMSQRIDNSLAFFKIPFFLLANVAWRPFVFSNFLIFNFTLPILLISQLLNQKSKSFFLLSLLVLHKSNNKSFFSSIQHNKIKSWMNHYHKRFQNLQSMKPRSWFQFHHFWVSIKIRSFQKKTELLWKPLSFNLLLGNEEEEKETYLKRQIQTPSWY